MLSLILGLGNPGSEYAGTRHNLGFDVLDGVAARLEATDLAPRQLYRLARAECDGRSVHLAWPETFMNRSGCAAEELIERLGLPAEQMLVVVDDFNLPLGALRLRPSGSDGGHNGLASLIEELGTTDFPRLRLGIGPAPDEDDTADYVLSRFRPDEEDDLQTMKKAAVAAVLGALSLPFDQAMSRHNINPARS